MIQPCSLPHYTGLSSKIAFALCKAVAVAGLCVNVPRERFAPSVFSQLCRDRERDASDDGFSEGTGGI